MRRSTWVVVFLSLSVSLPSLADDRIERLPPRDRKWLEEEVVYIITDIERDVFLSLDSQEERERFVDAFWRIRDPNPATKENEFFIEHYRRLQYANTKLSRETARPGWKTDRGRMYIILGEPRQISRFEAQNEIVQCELWVYSAQPEKGLPSSFNLLFFRRRGLGEYALYDPVLDGPNALMTGHQYTPTADNEEALMELQRISPELARASLTLDLSEPVDFGSRRPSLGTNILLARIAASATRPVRTDYADAYRRYGDRVTAEYSFRYVPNESEFVVMDGPESTSFVHFTVELAPEDFALQVSDDESKFYTTLDVSREARTPDGVLVAASDDEVYLEVPRSEFEKGARLPFAYQDAFPLIPGEYRVSVVLKNRAVHQFTVAEGSVSVPMTTPGTAGLGGLVLGYLHETPFAQQSSDYVRAFQFGYDRVYPAVGGLFPIGTEIVALARVHAAEKGSTLRFSIVAPEGTAPEGSLDSRVTPLEDGAEATAVESFRLLQVSGGEYELRLELLDASGALVSSDHARLAVSPLSDVARPGFIYRNGFRVAPGAIALARGDQLWSLKRYDEATVELGRAVEQGGAKLPEASWKLAGALLSAKRPDEALALLAPLEARFPDRFEVVGGLGYAYYFKGDFAKAREHLEHAASLRAPDASLLNALGDSNRQLGDLDGAAEAYQRSLALDPGQEPVKKLLESLKPESR